MPSSSATSSGRQSRSMSVQDRRRGRSRSPSAYLRKKGKSFKGILGGGADKSKKDRKIGAKAKSLNAMSAEVEKKTTSKTPEEEPIPEEKAVSETERESEVSTGEKAETPSPEVTIPEDTASADEEPEVKVVVDEESTGSDEATTGEVTVEEDAKSEAPVVEDSTDDKSATKESIPVSSKNPQDGTIPEEMPSLDVEETVQIILLLMDFDSRRFELLQLEFNPKKALVHDVLAQIPKAATEDVLRTQAYDGICSVDGSEMPPDVQLNEYVNGENDVKLAIPFGITGRECAVQASPILNDNKVRAMLNQPPIEQDKRASTDAAEDQIADILNGKPSSSESKAAVAFEGKKLRASPGIEQAPKSKGFMVKINLMATVGLALSIIAANYHITKPLSPGSKMMPGDFVRKCGLASLTHPDFSGCSEMSAEFDEDGIFSVYHLGHTFGTKSLVYTIKPENDKVAVDDAEMILGEDGVPSIGGQPMVVEFVDGDVQDLSPWPFTTDVQLKKGKKKGGAVQYKFQ